jgi:hypothetical protein
LKPKACGGIIPHGSQSTEVVPGAHDDFHGVRVHKKCIAVYGVGIFVVVVVIVSVRVFDDGEIVSGGGDEGGGGGG